MEKLDLITIGESLIELSTEVKLSDAMTLNKYYGGDTLAVAVAAKRMGSNVGFITKIGNDYFKDYLLESWQNEGLEISKISVIDGFNGIYFVARPENEQKEFSYYRKKTAASQLNVNDIDKDYITSAKVIYSSGVTQSLSISTREIVKEIFKIAKENNIITSYDPNFSEEFWSIDEAREALFEIIEYVDVLFISTTKIGKELVTIDSINTAIKYFWDRGVKTVIVKSTKDNGYYVGWDGEIVFIDYFSNENIKDTTCAGDVFNGAFIHAMINGNSSVESAKFAAVVSSLQSRETGAIKSIPYKDTVKKYYKGNND